MTRPSLLSLALITGLAACGGDDSLSVRGEAVFTAPDGSGAGAFSFPSDMLLIEDDLVDMNTEVFAGHCQIGALPDGTEVVNVAILRPNAEAVAFQPRRFALAINEADGTGSVEADLGGEVYSASISGDCTASLNYVLPGDGLVGATFDCDLAGAEGTANTAGEFFFEGCSHDRD